MGALCTSTMKLNPTTLLDTIEFVTLNSSTKSFQSIAQGNYKIAHGDLQTLLDFCMVLRCFIFFVQTTNVAALLLTLFCNHTN